MLVDLPDGRHLDVLLAGPADGTPLVFHYGTPSGAVPYAPMVDAAARHGLRTVVYSRPGYAGSSPQPDRTVADAAADTAAVLDALGAGSFVTVGWSGGGPHALACAALLPDRCAAAASLAGVAPFEAPGLDWTAGMGLDNIEEFGAATAGEPALAAYLTEQAGVLAHIHGDDVAQALCDLISDVDGEQLTGGFAEFLAASFRRAVSSGISGWRDDDLAFVRDWGFALPDRRTGAAPVAIWQGGQDRMVPYAHGEWLVANVPGARAHLLPAEGHLSLVVGSFEEIVADLVAMAG
jgi:pimeloyl-ACP methyl ester carboxylesterase